MSYYALHYTLAADYIQQRNEYRIQHFEYITPYYDKGTLLLGGAFDNIEKGALLIFKTNNATTIEEFAQNDPYVQNHVVTKWEISKWNVAIGNQ